MADPQSLGLKDFASGEAPARAVPDSWRSHFDASAAASREVRGGNFVQLATVDAAGVPHNRTVVFRGFLGDRGALKFITDSRSEKVQQVANSPACELVSWFGKTSEQYRIAGRLQLVGADCADATLAEARVQQWGVLSDAARESYWWRPGGTPFEPQNESPTGGRDSAGSLLPPPGTFLLMLLWPRRVDYLRLTDNYRQVDTETDGCWTPARVNP